MYQVNRAQRNMDKNNVIEKNWFTPEAQPPSLVTISSDLNHPAAHHSTPQKNNWNELVGMSRRTWTATISEDTMINLSLAIAHLKYQISELKGHIGHIETGI